MTYDKVQEYIDLSNKMFEYLNGEINKVNNNVIFIVSHSDSLVFGEMRNNITLKLYIYTIIYNSSKIDVTIKNNILFTIIHELFHADQCMNLKEYQVNDEYSNMIEAQANFMTAVYMINNRVILEKLFGFKILVYNLKIYLDKLRKFDYGISYRRTNIFNYYYEVFKYLMGSSTSISNLLYYETDIEFHCQNHNIIIKKNNIFNSDILNFNKILHENYVKIDRKNHNIVVTKYESGLVIIKSHLKGYLRDAIEFL